jgi:hypothetical protein
MTLREVKNYTRNDIVKIAEDIYSRRGGKKSIIRRIERFREVPKPDAIIHNFYYVYQGVYDYGDLNTTLSLAMICLAKEDIDPEKAIEYGKDFKEILLKLVEIGYLIDYTFCDKAFDGYALALIVHAWLHLKKGKLFDKIFNEEEKDIIENWMHARAKLMYRDKDQQAWATYRPYDNQEIGVGCNILLSQLLKEKDPELAQKLVELCDSRVIGWEIKNGNPDDTQFYTPIWVNTLYFYCIYRPKLDWLRSENCRHTFEAFLHQMPGNGLGSVYNWMFTYSYPALMALGAHIFKDGRYKWMANRLLTERLEERNLRHEYLVSKISLNDVERLPEEERNVVKTEIERLGCYDHVWEGLSDNLFHLWLYWDDELIPVMPSEGSMILEKSAGQGRWPYDPQPSLSEKIVFRQGWQDDDMFALLNIWGGQNTPYNETVSHRYPGSNEIITLVYGEPFVIQNTNVLTRDVNIKREELNAFNIKVNGKWINSLEKTYNARVHCFERLYMADFSKTTLYEYFGWLNERACMMVRDGYFVVFDYCSGPEKAEVGIRWHLQGDIEKEGKDSLHLKLRDKRMMVCYPHKDQWYQVKRELSAKVIPVYQHHADMDLDMISEADRTGFAVVFYPLKNGAAPSIEYLDVTRYGKSVYPLALGLKIRNDSIIDIVGMRASMFLDEYTYGDIKTDAEMFIYRKGNRAEVMDFVKARSITIKIQNIDNQNVYVKLNGLPLDTAFYRIINGHIVIGLNKEQSGVITIQY